MEKFTKSKLLLQIVVASFVATLATASIVGATTIGTDISTGGTLGVTGVTTLGNNITVPAAYGLDTTGAGALNIGTSTATSITIGDTGVTTTNAGPLTVTEATTLSSTLAVTATTTLNGYAVVATTRRTADAYAYGFDINTDTFFTGGAAKKSYLLSVRGDRTVSYPASGDSNDAYIKVAGNNYAYNDGNFILRGINSGINNRSGGYLGTLEGASIGAQNKSGGYASTTRVMTLTAENYGTVTDQFGAIDAIIRNEGPKATLQYGIRVRNNGANAGAVGDAALLINAAEASGTWNYGLDMNGATINTAAIRLQNATTISSGTARPATCVKGSLFTNTTAGTLNVCLATDDWGTVTVTND